MDDDLTPFFLHAIERRGQWSAEMFPRALEIITGLLGLAQAGEPGTITIDWNRDSAERWGRVLYDRYAVTIGRIDMPLDAGLRAGTGPGWSRRSCRGRRARRDARSAPGPRSRRRRRRGRGTCRTRRG